MNAMVTYYSIYWETRPSDVSKSFKA